VEIDLGWFTSHFDVLCDLFIFRGLNFNEIHSLFSSFHLHDQGNLPLLVHPSIYTHLSPTPVFSPIVAANCFLTHMTSRRIPNKQKRKYRRHVPRSSQTWKARRTRPGTPGTEGQIVTTRWPSLWTCKNWQDSYSVVHDGILIGRAYRKNIWKYREWWRRVMLQPTDIT
jgi:hypothetical protein